MLLQPAGKKLGRNDVKVVEFIMIAFEFRLHQSRDASEVSWWSCKSSVDPRSSPLHHDVNHNNLTSTFRSRPLPHEFLDPSGARHQHFIHELRVLASNTYSLRKESNCKVPPSLITSWQCQCSEVNTFISN
jgi:hypothetical protein